MKFYTKKDILEALDISYLTLLRWEKHGIVKKPDNRARERIYTESEYAEILEKIKTARKHPNFYKLPIRLRNKKQWEKK